MSRAAHRIGRFTLDPGRGALVGEGGEAVPLRPKSFALLHHLAENAGRIVAREELLDAVWPGLAVTDDSITQCVAEVRRALGEDDAWLLRTLPKRGYLLAAPPDGAVAGTAANGGAAAPDRPSLAVLPFANMSGDPEQDYFADGMAEELTTALSRVRWFLVVSRNSAFAYKGKAVDARQIGRELGARYLLEGSVRKAGGRVRIACQLIAAETGHHVWSERFEGDLADIFELQDKVAEAVAGCIEPNLERAEIERVRRKPTDSLDAYDLYLRSLPPFFNVTEQGTREALALLRRAIALDPGFALAKGHAALCQVRRVGQGWAGPGDREEGARLAREALAACGDDPLTLTAVVHALNVCASDRAGAISAARRALALNPNSPWVLNTAGHASLWAGEAEAAAAHFARAISLAPHDSEMAWSFAGLGYACLMLGRPEEALAHAEAAVRAIPAVAFGHRLMIVVLCSLGRKAEAAAAAERLRRGVPGAADVRAEAIRRQYADQAFAERLIAAFRDAGLPE